MREVKASGKRSRRRRLFGGARSSKQASTTTLAGPKATTQKEHLQALRRHASAQKSNPLLPTEPATLKSNSSSSSSRADDSDTAANRAMEEAGPLPNKVAKLTEAKQSSEHAAPCSAEREAGEEAMSPRTATEQTTCSSKSEEEKLEGQEGQEEQERQEERKYSAFSLKRCMTSALVTAMSGMSAPKPAGTSLYLVLASKNEMQPRSTDEIIDKLTRDGAFGTREKSTSSCSEGSDVAATGPSLHAWQPHVQIKLLRFGLNAKHQEYNLVGNIERVFAASRGQGKATIRLKKPALSIFISDSDPAELTAFLDTLYLIHTKPESVRLPQSANVIASVTPAKMQYRLVKRMRITSSTPVPMSLPQQLLSIRVEERTLFRVPSFILNATFLKSISLIGCKLKLQPDLRSFNSLGMLQLESNDLTVFKPLLLPACLEALSLKSNKIEIVPESIAHLKNLVRLVLQDNLIKEIPQSLRHLKRLRTLDISKNCLDFMPQSFGTIEAIYSVLNLDGNPLCAPITTEARTHEIVQQRLSQGEQTLSLQEICFRALPSALKTACRDSEDCPSFLKEAIEHSSRCAQCSRVFSQGGIAVIKQLDISRLADAWEVSGGVSGHSIPCKVGYCSIGCLQASRPERVQ